MASSKLLFLTAALAASYETPVQEEHPAFVLEVSSLPNRSKSKKSKASTQATNGNGGKPDPRNLLNQPGFLSPNEFLTRIRKAATQQEKIEAIALFTGYDFSSSFGAQELRATFEAKRKINPPNTNGLSHKEKDQQFRQAKGFVAGVSTPIQKKLLDLKSREHMAVENMIGHINDARTGTDETAAQKAALEKARLNRIQEDLDILSKR